MAAHKYWQALAMVSPTPATLELSEFHLYDGVTRVDAAATLTASAAPTGALANLKDDSTATGCYWAAGGDAVVLTWTFPTARNVDGIVIGARTTSSRYPSALVLRGGDATTGTGPSPEYLEIQFYGLGRFVSATKTGILRPLPSNARKPLQTRDLVISRGVGRIPFEVVREVLPRTNPKTYLPQAAMVRLERDIDGKVIRQVWSPTGVGTFEFIDENFTYTVTAIHPETGMRAVIADRIKPQGHPEFVE